MIESRSSISKFQNSLLSAFSNASRVSDVSPSREEVRAIPNWAIAAYHAADGVWCKAHCLKSNRYVSRAVAGSLRVEAIPASCQSRESSPRLVGDGVAWLV